MGNAGYEYRFLEPVDVLFLRGNRLFGEAGSYGESQMPPWPSVAAGAIRSRMLADKHADLADFVANRLDDPELGTPANPGSFVLAGFYLARRFSNGSLEMLAALPADLVVNRPESGELELRQVNPQPVAFSTSYPLPMLPVMKQGAKRGKPATGYWLTQAGWEAYLRGNIPLKEHLVDSRRLWRDDTRIGIGLSSVTRGVEQSRLFSVQAIVPYKSGHPIGKGKDAADYDVGFLAVVRGAVPPESGLLRFGGDGRATTISKVDFVLPEPDYEAIARDGRCRIVLTTPGLFPQGWRLPGTDGNNRVTLPGGIRGRLVSAAVPRTEMLSGWDLANDRPKAAQRVAPAGSVYWLDELEAAPEALRKLVEEGLWLDEAEDNDGGAVPDASRRAEGFNRIAIAAWPHPHRQVM